jgi:hypothetical protein
LVFFEFSTGPVIWLYIGEISNDVTGGVATSLNAAANLLIPNLLQTVLNSNDADNSGAGRAKPYHPHNIPIFAYGLGACTFLGGVFCWIYMKETMGKSKA